MSETIRLLEELEARLVFDHFGHLDAWHLGSRLTRVAQDAGHPIGIDIRRQGLILFRAVLPGVTPDQEIWIARKAAVVLRMEASSALVQARMEAAHLDPVAIGWLNHEYAVTGGSFPVRVRGVGVVAAVTASGLSSAEDHDLIVHGIESYLADGESNARRPSV